MAGEIQLNSVSLATESSGTVTLNSSTDIKGCLNASGSAPIYACRAWINFDGSSASIGTGRANGNVSGVTDNGTGDYTVTFATAMPDVNYSFVASAGSESAITVSGIFCGLKDHTTTGYKLAGSIQLESYIINASANRTNVDQTQISLAIFR